MPSETKSRLMPGQKLWFVSKRQWRKDSFLTLSSVGRKFATFEELRPEYRLVMETLVVETPSHGSIGRCYLRKEEHDAILYRRQVEAALRRNASELGSLAYPIDVLVEAARILGVKLPPAPGEAEGRDG